MAERSLLEALDAGGAFEVWRLLEDEDKKLAAAACWERGDRLARQPLEALVAKKMKFRPSSVKKLPANRVVPWILNSIEELPQEVVFQLLYYLHMEHRKEMMVSFLDDAGIPHKDGVLDLPEDAGAPSSEALKGAAERLLESEGKKALVYLATLWISDKEFWAGLEPVLSQFNEEGEKAGSSEEAK